MKNYVLILKRTYRNFFQQRKLNIILADPAHFVVREKFQPLHDSNFVQFILYYNGIQNLNRKYLVLNQQMEMSNFFTYE